MKKARIALFFLLSLTITLNAQAAKVVELSYSNWSPYLDPAQQDKGFLAERVRKALKSQGYDVRFVYFDDWVKAYRAAVTGKVDGSVGWACNYVRSTQFYFTYPIVSSNQVLFHLKKNPVEWKTTKDLNKYGKMGVTVGYFYGKTYQTGRINKDFQIIMNKDDHANFKQLLAGHIGTFLMDEEVGKQMLHKEFAAKERLVTYSPHELDKTWLYVVINRQVKDGVNIKNALNLGIKDLVAHQEMQKVPFKAGCGY